MATIAFADEIAPTKSNDGLPRSPEGAPHGVFSMRNMSVYSIERRNTFGLGRASSFDRRRSRSGTDMEADEDEDSGLRAADDYKQRQVFHGAQLLWLAYQSIGTIYGDIGTSPLYVFSSTFTSNPSWDDLVGVLSLVIWSLTIMVTVKYVLVILHADNEGEGGTFSCYSLLSRYANITERDPREASLVHMERHLTTDLDPTARHVRSGLEKSAFARGLLKTVGVLAVSMVMSDGVLTPAQSVLGAVQGITVINPNLSTATVVGTTCGILILLFLIQPLGTTRIASAFAPIVIIWLAFNAAFGIYNLVMWDHSVLKAFSPYFAFTYLIRNKTDGWRSLGGVLLSFTGVEALFADLGAFSRQAIQLSWLCYTFPCLLLAYVGQAAYISVNPAGYSNPFFNSVPPGALYPSLIIAVLAAIVASQAIITATFQLLAQIMKLSYFPQIKVVHTSKVFFGQIYVPLLNWLLMVGTVLIAAIYNNTVSLGNAYGVCVMFVTFFDTCMVTLVALIVWRIKPYFVVLPWLTIACIDGTYLSSVLTKVPDGAWFTLTLAAILAGLFILWRFGKEQQWKAEAADRFPTSHFVHKNSDGSLALAERYGGTQLSSIKGFGVFFDKAGETTPTVFSQFVRKLIATPEVMVFFHLRPLEKPTVPDEERYHVSRLGIPNCYRLIVRHGYMDEVVTPNLGALICEKIRDFIVRQNVPKLPPEQRDSPVKAESEKDAAQSTAAATEGGVSDTSTEKKRSSGIDSSPDQKPSAPLSLGIPAAGSSSTEGISPLTADPARPEPLNEKGENSAAVAESSSKKENTGAGSPEDDTAPLEKSDSAAPVARTSSIQFQIGSATGTSAVHPTSSSTSAAQPNEASGTATATATDAAPASGTTGVQPTASGKRKAAATNPTAELSRLEQAFGHQVLYIIGKEEMHIQTATRLPRRVLLSAFLWIRDNTRTKIAALRVPTERVVEVGFVKDV